MSSMQQTLVTFSDGIGDDGQCKGTVLIIPPAWDDGRTRAEICAFTEARLGLLPGSAWILPDVETLTANLAVYDCNGTMLAAVSLGIAYAASPAEHAVSMTAEEYQEYLLACSTKMNRAPGLLYGLGRTR